MAPYNRRRRNLQCYLAVLSITIAAATALSACGGGCFEAPSIT